MLIKNSLKLLCLVIACILVMLTSMAWLAYGGDFIPYDYTTYFGATDHSVTVSWDANVPSPDRYEVDIFNIERGTIEKAGTGTTTTTSITFKLPFSGHFVAKVRACQGDRCGDWTESTDSDKALVNGVHKGWWLYGHVAPAGPITITPP